MRARRFTALLLFSLLLFLAACGRHELPQLPGAAGTAIPGKAQNRPEAGEGPASVRQTIRQQLAADNYRAALVLVRREVSGNLPEAALAEEYARALNGVLRQAEQYREKGLPARAGPLYREALESFPVAPPVAERVSLTPVEISARIASCASQLMDRGLVAYRSGDLDLAISTWKAIRTFDPRHQASQQAQQTAEVQRSNLEKVPGKK